MSKPPDAPVRKRHAALADPAPPLRALPAVSGKKVTAAFDGRTITTDAGLLVARAERRLGIAERLTARVPGHRDPTRITHGPPDVLRARFLAIAAGYEGEPWKAAVGSRPMTNDGFDALHRDPALRMALGVDDGARGGVGMRDPA